MRILCASCQKEFKSLIIDNTMAWNECMEKLTIHATKRHPQTLAELQLDLQKMVPIFTSYVSTIHLIDIPEDEKYLLSLMEKTEKDIMSIMGIGDEEDEEEVSTESEPIPPAPEQEPKESDLKSTEVC